MDKHEQNESRVASISASFRQRAENVAAAHADGHVNDTEAQVEQAQARLDQAEAQHKAAKDGDTGVADGLDHVDQPLPEEQRFVGNPDELRKEVDSEEKFSEGLEGEPDDLEVTDEKKTAAKKTAAKKASAK